MTMQDRNAFLQQLKDDPLLFYKTMVENVSQLDKIRQRFQYMLSAYEAHMDPAVLETYHAQRRVDQEEQMRNAGKVELKFNVEPGTPAERHGSGLNQVGQSTASNLNTQTRGLTSSFTPADELPFQPKQFVAPPTQEPSTDELMEKVVSMVHDAMVRDGKVGVTREAVAKYVNSARDPNIQGIIDSVARTLKRLQPEPPRGPITDGNFDNAPGQGMPTQAEIHEFPLTSAGAAARTLYAEGGILSKILNKRLHRYGVGVVDQIDAVMASVPRVIGANPFWAESISIPSALPGGIYTTSTDLFNNQETGPVVSEQSIGILVAGGMFKFWLPLYLNQTPTAPPIYVYRPRHSAPQSNFESNSKYEVSDTNSFEKLDHFDPAVSSRMMNELTRAMSIWYGTIRHRTEQPFTR